ncbi:MAG: riboflavin synthase, partial [Chloroflexi bacterium]
MFTGIVEEIGTVQSTTADAELGKTMTIGCSKVMADASIGDSIAVNGICLTVTAYTATSFTIGVSPETLRRTDLGRLTVGDGVNLERSLAFGGRMGG